MSCVQLGGKYWYLVSSPLEGKLSLIWTGCLVTLILGRVSNLYLSWQGKVKEVKDSRGKRLGQVYSPSGNWNPRGNAIRSLRTRLIWRRVVQGGGSVRLPDSPQASTVQGRHLIPDSVSWLPWSAVTLPWKARDTVFEVKRNQKVLGFRVRLRQISIWPDSLCALEYITTTISEPQFSYL